MVILALETATRRGSLALWTDDGPPQRAERAARPEDAGRTHGERLPADALALLREHGRALRDVDRFAIVSGPGSFTGLRVGMAVVQGFALVTGRPVSPIPTLEAIAEGWRLGAGGSALGTREPRPSTGSGRPELVEGRNPGTPEPRNQYVLVCLDGQRGDLFYAAWRVVYDEPIERAQVLIEPSVGSAAEIVQCAGAAGAGRGAVIVGLGLETHLAGLAPLGWPIEEGTGCLAAVAAAIAARRPELAGPPHALRPLYIRRPDAVIARERAGRS
jgi:tRNA threonylcarbamoyl adenosine modification protein YeaZ